MIYAYPQMAFPFLSRYISTLLVVIVIVLVIVLLIVIHLCAVTLLFNCRLLFYHKPRLFFSSGVFYNVLSSLVLNKAEGLLAQSCNDNAGRFPPEKPFIRWYFPKH